MMDGILALMPQQESYLAAISFAGLLIRPSSGEVNTRTPVCLIHGEDDWNVPVSGVDVAVQVLNEYDIKNEFHKLPKVDHESILRGEEGIKIAVDFIKRKAL